MRRAIGYSSFTFGCLLLFLAPLLYFYVTPRIEKTPYDVYDRTVSLGTGSYFSPTALRLMGPVPVRNLAVSKGRPSASNDDVAVINVFTRTTDLQHGNDIDIGDEVYAFDRTTGYAVHCCGERPPAAGLTLKFPFHTERTTYPFWDGTAGRAFPARYTGSQIVAGLSTDVFVSTPGPILLGTIKVPGKIATGVAGPSVTTFRFYRATTTMWVEPFTGAIVKVGQRSTQWITDGTGVKLQTLADVTVVNDARSVADTAGQVRGQLWQLKLVSRWLPVLGPLVGLILVVMGWRLVQPREPRLPIEREDLVVEEPLPSTA